ncbi:TauD/TfdA family dioxygenase [Streptomyces sp. NPDC057257]|uniref:TauD/TfdA family dioxygenase n=1 Tax=Streptomyces sp. NPDC057257 TaxID=3346071 RepID=UPI00363617AE
MPKSADSVLSFLDGNGNPVPEEALRSTYAKLLRTNGYVHLVDVPDTFDHVGFLRGFGDFLPSPTGTLVGDMVPEPGMDGIYHSGNQQALVPHTEGYDLDELPARYLALWCVVPPSGEGGETTLFDGFKLVNSLGEDERKHLETQTYTWSLAAGLQSQGMMYQAEHPVLETVDDELLLRFSYNNLRRPDGDETVADFLERGKERFDAEHTAVRYRPGDLLHWDNWRMLHARNAFEDPHRHLKRVMIRHRAPQTA